MAEAKSQEASTQQQRGVKRRHEYSPSRDLLNFNPFSMMRRLSEEMDRAFSSSLGLWRGSDEGMWAPPVEVRERNGNVEICAELPGMTKDDIKVEWTDQGLVIEGEKKREKQSEEGGYFRSERSYGHFYRTVPLPEGTDTSKIKAEFKNGVLQIQAPLSEQRRRKQIPIG